MLHSVALLRTDVSEELRASINWLNFFAAHIDCYIVTANVVPISLVLVTLMKEALSSLAD
jgi:hypothetical protein